MWGPARSRPQSCHAPDFKSHATEENLQEFENLEKIPKKHQQKDPAKISLLVYFFKKKQLLRQRGILNNPSLHNIADGHHLCSTHSLESTSELVGFSTPWPSTTWSSHRPGITRASAWVRHLHLRWYASLMWWISLKRCRQKEVEVWKHKLFQWMQNAFFKPWKSQSKRSVKTLWSEIRKDGCCNSHVDR